MPKRIDLRIVHVDPELRRRWKALCALRGVSVSEGTIKLIEVELAKHEKSAK